MTQEDCLYYALFAKFTKGIGPVLAKDLLLSPRGYLKLDLNNETIKSRVEKEIKLIKEHNIKTVTIMDRDYPKDLFEIRDLPTVLYYYGTLKEEHFLFATVGTRKPSKYGIETTKMIVSQLCKSGVVIVSGLAYGIDSVAHEVSLEHKMPTYAVLGCGLDCPYPRYNMWMRDAIIKRGGAIISEYPVGTQALSSHFPMRNRIISGISKGVLIVEAGEKSGSLITAKLALDQAKNIYTIPGSVFGGSFKGNHHLIRLGAGLVENGQQILEEYPEYNFDSFSENRKKTSSESVYNQTNYSQNHLSSKDFPTFLAKPKKSKPTPIIEPKEEHYRDLTADEFIIYQLLDHKKSLDDLLFEIEYPIEKLLAILTSLILKGMIIEEGGYYFII